MTKSKKQQKVKRKRDIRITAFVDEETYEKLRYLAYRLDKPMGVVLQKLAKNIKVPDLPSIEGIKVE